MTFETPQEWKSEVWWRNRPLPERVFHLALPRRIAEALETYELPRLFEVTPGYVIRGNEFADAVQAAFMLKQMVTGGEGGGKHAGLSGRWIDADDYIEMLKDSFDSQGGLPAMYANPYLDKYIKGVFDVIVLDGLGEERRTEFAVHELGTLIKKRYDRMKTTIITTSLSVSDIANRYGRRVSEALADFTVL